MIDKPKLINKPDLSELHKALNELMDFWETYPKDGHEDLVSDYEQAVLKRTILAFFGENAWDYITQQIDTYDRVNYPEF